MQLRAACAALRRGGVIAYPTEGVWALGCDPLNAMAVDRLLALKRRDWRKGLILIAADFGQLEPFVVLPSRTAQKRAFSTWPGPHTWVFPASDHTPMWISGERDSVAIRVTAHPLARELCLAYGGPIVSTSANRAGHPPALSATAVRLNFPGRLDALLPGPLGGREGPTVIRDVISGMILRR
ncbi:MAG: Sua5/YciO/YrdC/YwlC family protein [Nevskia sp.]|nr:Sua5/YciO/YrdC/YwlC family protein [Nevskia sp.]